MPYRTPGEMPRIKRPGGTSGGTGKFLLGCVLLIAGGYLFLDNVTVHGNYGAMFGFGGRSSFGLTLIPLMFGVALLFYNGKNLLGWFLTGGSLLAMFVGIIASLNAHYQSTSLYNTLIIFGLIAGGAGLIIRSLKEHRESEEAKNG
tara:strand:- start:52312 stop:52749 length:438 start_codon:yes stop_codon:yes gene_type:complete